MTARHLTVRAVPREIAKALELERKRRGKSLNQTVIEVLGDALGVGGQPQPTNGLERLAGTWSAADLEAFESACKPFEQIDEELWGPSPASARGRRTRPARGRR
jgi:hypothetical protein